ncbi:hypothetical protein POTOM_037614 [Populus tomentosa]|uniref:CCT domain-containing protein n=1 Tax=Populus tomentosa TaxID=118781 RepID=A0A8X7YV43_POPTO|nr:hypothetical protein POTOM_037614 [Populus tomentosa]
MLQTMKNHCWRMPKGKDDVSSPISGQILEFCDPEFFQETLQNSEVTFSSYCCYENSSYTNNLPSPPDIDRTNCCQDNNGNHNCTTPTTTTASTTTTTAANTNNINNNDKSNMSIISDYQGELVSELSASIDFSPSTFSFPTFISTRNDQFDFSSVQPQLAITDVVCADGLSQYTADPAAPITGHPLPSVFEEDCLSSVPCYVPLNPSSPTCSFLGPAMSTCMLAGTMNAALSAGCSGIFDGGILTGSEWQPLELDYRGENGGIYCPDSLGPAMSASMLAGTMNAALSADCSGIFDGGILTGSEWQPLELDYRGENGGIYCPDSLQKVFNPGDLQALGNKTPKLVGGPVSSAPLTSQISSLADSTFKVGKLSVEQRKEKIRRYMKKRNERNFSKKIKYACRKTLADNRPRVRGRFAKNDDFVDIHRTVCGRHEDEGPAMKEEDVTDSDIFAHISGVKTFKCNYSIQSWI